MTRSAAGQFRRRTRLRESLPATMRGWPGLVRPDVDCGRHEWQTDGAGRWQCRHCTATRATDPWAHASLRGF